MRSDDLIDYSPGKGRRIQMARVRNSEAILRIATGRTTGQIEFHSIPALDDDYQALRTRMSQAYNDGRAVAAVSVDRLGRNVSDVKAERKQASVAYDLTETEPACSFVIGYAAELETFLISA
jgi:hypothetical protein